MRVSRQRRRLWGLSSASSVPGPWDFQYPSPAARGVSKCAAQPVPRRELYTDLSAYRPEEQPPRLPQFIADPDGRPTRAIVWMRAHGHANFTAPQIQNKLSRVIAWAGSQSVDELVDCKPPPASRS